MNTRYYICFFLACFFCNMGIYAQETLCYNSTEGKDFWIGFMENRWGFDDLWSIEEHFVEITLTSKFDVNYTLMKGTTGDVVASGFFPANTSQQIRLDWTEVEPIGSENIENMGLHLVTDNVINVYAYNFDYYSSDAALIYPTRTLGNEYYAICYEPTQEFSDSSQIPAGDGKNSQFLVVATEDNTTVTITPSKVTDKLRPANIPFNITLNQGEVYQVQSENIPNLPGQGDLTGSHIISDKPIAFFSGSWAASVPSPSCCWDHLYEQIPPVKYWGSDFVTAPILSKLEDTYRVIASEDNTNVFIGALNTNITLNAGQFYEYDLQGEASRVTSNKPILVMQYSQSGYESLNQNGDPNGDPFTVAMFPITSYVTETTYEVYDSPVISTYYVNIIAPNSNIGNILVDGNNISGQFVNIANSNYSYAQVELFTAGQHQIESTNPDQGFVAYQYGFGSLESYGYGIAFNMRRHKVITSSGKIVEDTLVACLGDEIEITVDGSFDSYQWGTGETDETIYTHYEGALLLTSFAEECNELDTVYIHRLYADVNPIDTMRCDGAILDIEASAVGFRESAFNILEKDAQGNLLISSSNPFYQSGSKVNTFDFSVQEPLPYYVSVTSNNLSCLDSGMVVLDTVKPNADFHGYVLLSNSLVFDVPAKSVYVENWSSNAVNYIWDFGDGTDTVSFFQGDYSYEHFGTYPITLYAEDEFGCWDTITKSLRLFGYEVFAQNVIHINSNIEPNKLFAPIITNLDMFLDLKYNLKIYDRWGALIFESDAHDEYWNGTIMNNGENFVAHGNYVWVLTVSDLGLFEHKYYGSILMMY